MMQNQETSERTYATWTTKWFKEAPKKVVNTLWKTTPFTLLECEEPGTCQSRRCDGCAGCYRCPVRTQESAWKELESPSQIKVSLMSDPENNALASRYSLLDNPSLLTEDKDQAVKMAASLEKKLLRMLGDQDAYNLALEDLLGKGVLK